MSFLRAEEAHRQKKNLKKNVVKSHSSFGCCHLRSAGRSYEPARGGGHRAGVVCVVRAAALFFLHAEKRASGPAPALGLPPARSVKLFWVSWTGAVRSKRVARRETKGEFQRNTFPIRFCWMCFLSPCFVQWTKIIVCEWSSNYIIANPFSSLKLVVNSLFSHLKDETECQFPR